MHRSHRNGGPLGSRRCRVMACVITIAALLTVWNLQAGLSVATDANAGEPPLSAAPDFNTFDIQGNNRRLSTFLNAKPLLLEFMSLDCPHCMQMAPILTRAHAAYGEKIQFLTVAFDKSIQRIRRFAHSEKHPWPYLVGTQRIIEAYRLEGVPTFCFLAPDGRVVRLIAGSMPETQFREHLDALLKAK